MLDVIMIREIQEKIPAPKPKPAGLKRRSSFICRAAMLTLVRSR